MRLRLLAFLPLASCAASPPPAPAPTTVVAPAPTTVVTPAPQPSAASRTPASSGAKNDAGASWIGVIDPHAGEDDPNAPDAPWRKSRADAGPHNP